MVVARSDYDTILRENLPVLDVRAPTEFERGCIPNSTNLPILNDNERARVGIAYRERGNAAALDLGFSLVNGREKDHRVNLWSRFLNARPNALLTCWRGGQRSEIAQQWLNEVGIEVPRIAGGFKAIRKCSLDVFEQVKSRKWLVIAGSTGVGKTQFLNTYRESVDLEAIAQHRGSAFGQLNIPQPTPISFELALAQRLLQTVHLGTCLVEDESRTIGRLAIPSQLYEAMQCSPIVVLEASFDARVQLTYEYYVRSTDAPNLVNALGRIRKRLGQERYEVVKSQQERAINQGSESLHLNWIASLFNWYYDPMYEYQLNRKLDRVVFRGDAQAVSEYLSHEAEIERT
ncbi:MAG: tRNA 2-selenouridine(34) synthase MnmH [Gammaproteobacteria bacterium]|nr:tRNA 2-selenouridine(34) synthase MnmH [Gammaproteobacteria bacterium]